MSEELVAIDWAMPVDQWSSLLGQCPQATIFHSPRWSEAMAQVFGGRPHAASFSFADGSWGLWPITDKPLARGCLPFAVSTEAGGYGGPLFPVAPAARKIEQICLAVAGRWPSLDVHGNPFAALRLPWTSQATFTHAVDPATARLARGCRARIHRAERGGFAVEIERSAAPFLALYRQAVVRWGRRLTWRRPDAYFQAVLALDEARCFVATRSGEVAAAMIVLEGGRILHYLAGAIGSDYLDTGASNLLLGEILKWSGERGFEQVDLGPSAGLAGVIQFKESFGASPLWFENWVVRSSVHRLYDQTKGLLTALPGRVRLPGMG
ncbi:MAG: GNAT family N-acetyltransferase [Cyanobacteria bacterium REEB65]|nr:GNAT family N-acetyltransferase [Cyanobacteria bacterium REEB65]